MTRVHLLVLVVSLVVWPLDMIAGPYFQEKLGSLGRRKKNNIYIVLHEYQQEEEHVEFKG